MQRQIYITAIIGLIILIACASQPTGDSLDAIRPFKPDDKYFKSSLVSLHFIIETSSTSRVDSVFAAMIGAYDLPVDAAGCQDGVYEGESPSDAFDYKHWVRLEIKDEKIVNVEYDEIHVNGMGKEHDEAYNEEMSKGGARPSEAYPSMEQQLRKKQNMLDVDGTSGASYSLYRFRYAVTVALMKARLNS